MSRAGERQGDLATAIGLSRAQVSRKQSGAAHWSLDDVDLLAAHYGLPVLGLLAGPTRAVAFLHGAAAPPRPQETAPPGPGAAAHAPAPEDAPDLAAALSPAGVPDAPALPLGSRVLCGQEAVEEVDGFPST
ncbi:MULTISPECIES: helix-turn-helix domain-containing protein [unclassified Streptomyces]|uniref:helix-turn-helix domain-containing protein n=1 Tax=unclassified Streptomyces TaxID=2593676 RepID=UPI0036FA19A3